MTDQKQAPKKAEPPRTEFILSENMKVKIERNQGRKQLTFTHVHGESTFIGIMADKAEIKQFSEALKLMV